MYLSLCSLEYSASFHNVEKIVINLRSGQIEILKNHQEILGIIPNHIVEIEQITENQIQRYIYVLEAGIAKVIPASKSKEKETSVELFAKTICALHLVTLEELAKKYEEKKKEYEKENTEFQKSEDSLIRQVLKTKLLMLEREVDFASQCLFFKKNKQ